MKITDSITIVIPSYNEERYIYQTLYSISNQNGFSEKIRVIIADANSTDNTIEEIHKADNNFKNLQIEIIEGGTVGFARNKGAALVKTPYILFMDADSILMEDDILWRVNNLKEKYDIITCKQKSTTNSLLPKITWGIFEFIRKMMSETFCTGCFFFISNKQFHELGGFDETLNNSEDFWLSRKVPKKYFKILNRYVGQDERRFQKMGYFKFIKILILNYWYKNNIEWFKKDVGYWEPYE